MRNYTTTKVMKIKEQNWKDDKISEIPATSLTKLDILLAYAFNGVHGV